MERAGEGLGAGRPSVDQHRARREAATLIEGDHVARHRARSGVEIAPCVHHRDAEARAVAAHAHARGDGGGDRAHRRVGAVGVDLVAGLGGDRVDAGDGPARAGERGILGEGARQEHGEHGIAARGADGDGRGDGDREGEGAQGRGADVGGEHDVAARGRAGLGEEGFEVLGERVRLEVLDERELDALGGEPALDEQRGARLDAERILRVGHAPPRGDHAAHPIEPRAAQAPPSISSRAIEQPRGTAPGRRPSSSTPAPVTRTRSAVWIATTESTLARSTKRAMPTSPGGAGASVSGSTASTRTHGGAAYRPRRATPGRPSAAARVPS